MAACLLTQCEDVSREQGVGWRPSQQEAEQMPPGYDQFVNDWNKRTRRWLERTVADGRSAIADKKAELSRTDDDKARARLEKELAEEQKALSILETRLDEGDYIRLLTPGDLPEGLVWEDGMDNPDIGDPRAKKGGSIRLAEPGSFPSTFRWIGPNSNNSFRGRICDEIEIPLVALHPETGRIIPGLASHWAVGEDGRTVYFRLFDDATYSDGTRVRATDFLVGMYISTSDYAQNPFHKTVYQENVSHITIYDDRTLSVTLPTPKPLIPYYASVFNPFPPGFYSEFGRHYVERYQWRAQPTTGAYVIDPDGMIRGRQVTMKRVENWWAKDKKFYRYRNNVDRIVYHFIAEESKALELFRIGEIDAYLLAKPELWYERMEIPEVHSGYINRATFFTVYPRPPLGFYLNTARPPFNDLNTRIGFHHSMNIQKVIDTTFRGDYQRMGSYASGFGPFTDTAIKAREYSPEKARIHFMLAGYTVTGSDGILRKPDGTRLTAEITFPNISPSMANIMARLKEDARKCGIEVHLDSLDSTVNFRKVMEKRHQAAYWSWAFPPPHPQLYQCMYSGYAYDAKGNPIPYTNNIFSYSNPEMDRLLAEERDAGDEEELQKTTFAIQQLMHREAIWVPGWTIEFTRIGFWKWVRWPDSDTTQFCFPLVFEPLESHLYWIDDEIREETLKAKREGRSFPEVEAVYDQYRFSSTAAQADEAARLSAKGPRTEPPSKR